MGFGEGGAIELEVIDEVLHEEHLVDVDFPIGLDELDEDVHQLFNLLRGEFSSPDGVLGFGHHAHGVLSELGLHGCDAGIDLFHGDAHLHADGAQADDLIGVDVPVTGDASVGDAQDVLEMTWCVHGVNF